MATDSRDIREELRELGQERNRIVADELDLAPRIEDALARARESGEVSVSEAARLLGLHRTTLYRVYRPRRRPT